MKGDDELSDWFKAIPDINIVDRRNELIVKKYRDILKFLQDSPLYTEKALRIWSDVNVADPWLIAAADVLGCTLVTFETSAGIIPVSSPSGKPKIPDIAKKFDVKCENLFYFIREMNISWS